MPTPTVEELISQIRTAKNPHLQRINPADVRAIINFGHVHIAPAFPEYPAYGKNATVVAPDHSVHTIQLCIVGRHEYERNRCTCVQCEGHCPAAIAAFLVELADYLKTEVKEDTCPFCQVVLGTGVESHAR